MYMLFISSETIERIMITWKKKKKKKKLEN